MTGTAQLVQKNPEREALYAMETSVNNVAILTRIASHLLESLEMGHPISQETLEMLQHVIWDAEKQAGLLNDFWLEQHNAAADRERDQLRPSLAKARCDEVQP